MTLIVGRVKGDKTYILGDTALTLYNPLRTNPFVNGCLKQYLVTDKLAIAFAGEQADFERACMALLSARTGSEAVQIALDAQSQGLDFELLVGEAGAKTLRVVKNGSASETVAGFIGDPSAFAAFQKYYHDEELGFAPVQSRVQIQILRLPEPILEDEIYERLYRALKDVIGDAQIPSVGGMVVSLCTDRQRFRYLNYADVTSDPLNITDFNETPKIIEFGTALRGGYSVEFGDDTPRGGDGKNVGFYFLQGGFGIVFPSDPSGLRSARVVKAKNPAYWTLETTRQLGHGIASSYMSADHCGIAGEELLKSKRHQDALFCYELGKDWKPLRERPSVHDRYFAGYAMAMFNCGKQAEAIAMLTDLLKEYCAFSACKNTLQQLIDARTK